MTVFAHAGKRGRTWRFTFDGPRHANGKRNQITGAGYRTRREAEAAEFEAKRRVRDGEYVSPTKLTLGEFLREHWIPAMSSRVRPSTLESYSRILRVNVEPHLGSLPIQSVAAGHLDRLYAELLAGGGRRATGLSPRSVRYTHTVLHGALGYAVRKQLVTKNVADLADPPSTTQAAPPLKFSCDATQLEVLLTHVQNDRLYAAWRLFVVTGARRGEIGGLCWNCVDLDLGEIRIERTLVQVGYEIQWSEPKTRRGRRTVSLDPETVAILRAHRRRQSEERLAWGKRYHAGDLVFAREDGSPIHPERWTRMLKAHARAAGLPDLHPHTLRDTAATLQTVGGVDIGTVSDRLGHADPGFTLRTYRQPVKEAEKRAALTMASLMTDASTRA